MGKQTSNEMRKLLCEIVFDRNIGLKNACAALDINFKTGRNICRLSLKEERSEKKKLTGRTTTFDQSYQTRIVNYFEQFSDSTLVAC